jgi:hypothetical protein
MPGIGARLWVADSAPIWLIYLDGHMARAQRDIM